MTSTSKPALWLQIGPFQTSLHWQDGAVGAILRLDLGLVKTAGQFFKPHPPTPLNLEGGIAAVEDELFKVRHLAPAPGAAQQAVLRTDDAVVRRIAAFAGVDASVMLSVQAVEHAFEDLAALSAGGRISNTPWATEPQVAAALLILRELMHHMGFGQIEVLQP
jgi:exopolyphosphatase/pppGpp-phosphohydrolase